VSSNIQDFPVQGRTIQKSKVGSDGLPLGTDEKLVLEVYLKGHDHSSREALEGCDRLGVPTEVQCTRVEAAVAQILIHSVQHRLPQWSTSNGEKVILGRKYRKRQGGQGLAFIAQHLFTINWADSGPGFSWPEAYHLTYVPGYEQYVVTASQDGADVWGCTDQAIGFFGASGNHLIRARDVIRGRWKAMRDEYDQPSWAYLFYEGLISTQTAEGWKRRVWARPE